MNKRKYRALDKYIQRLDTENTHGWYVLISYNETGKHSKLFSDSIYGGKWQAKTKAIHYANDLYICLFGAEMKEEISHLSVVQ